MDVLFICSKQLQNIANSVFDHEGAIVLPSSIRSYFDSHPLLHREKHQHYQPLRIRINGFLIETARLNRVGKDTGQYQLRLCDEATKCLMNQCAKELLAYQHGEEISPFTLLSVFWNDTDQEFVLTISRA